MSAPNLKPRKIPSGKNQMNLKKVQWVRIRRADVDTESNNLYKPDAMRSQSDGMVRGKETEQ
jgi:hypothetical protein